MLLCNHLKTFLVVILKGQEEVMIPTHLSWLIKAKGEVALLSKRSVSPVEIWIKAKSIRVWREQNIAYSSPFL